MREKGGIVCKRSAACPKPQRVANTKSVGTFPSCPVTSPRCELGQLALHPNNQTDTCKISFARFANLQPNCALHRASLDLTCPHGLVH